MANEDRFKQVTIVTLSKRAANHCSNPDCRAVTSGPAETPNDSINVGEAAHIYGANVGSARYREDMSSTERSDITNAIWLCSNCHKLIDDDEVRYPAGLLFEWQRSHEQHIAEQIGKASAEIRKRYETRHLEEFGKLSYLAERIILDKGYAWEYKLTAEVLRFEMKPILQRWEALKGGLYTKPFAFISKEDFIGWIQLKNAEMTPIVSAFDALVNKEFSKSWGNPGVPGDDIRIVTTCRLFAEACQSALDWEESIRFAQVHEIFEEQHALYFGISGAIIDESAKIPTFLSNIMTQEKPTGTHELKLTLSLPDGWVEAVSDATKRAAQRYMATLDS